MHQFVRRFQQEIPLFNNFLTLSKCYSTAGKALAARLLRHRGLKAQRKRAEASNPMKLERTLEAPRQLTLSR
jgi:hypothetical protein